MFLSRTLFSLFAVLAIFVLGLVACSVDDREKEGSAEFKNIKNAKENNYISKVSCAPGEKKYSVLGNSASHLVLPHEQDKGLKYEFAFKIYVLPDHTYTVHSQLVLIELASNTAIKSIPVEIQKGQWQDSSSGLLLMGFGLIKREQIKDSNQSVIKLHLYGSIKSKELSHSLELNGKVTELSFGLSKFGPLREDLNELCSGREFRIEEKAKAENEKGTEDPFFP